MKVYGALESAQAEWFTNAGKPAASSYPYRMIYVTDLRQMQVSDGTQWRVIGSRLDTYTSGTIPAAASNSNAIIWVSDLEQVQISNGSAWVQVGSKAGTKNYFSQNNANPDFETNSVTPWSACTLTFSSGAPSGAPTLTATQMAIATTATTPLSGTYSMLLTKAAANAQYQGFSSGSLSIDREDTAKVLYGSFYYEVVSGTIDLSGSSTQSLEIWIYNTVSGQWTQPAGYRGMNQSNGVGKVVFSFQTDGTYANNSYKIAVITQQTSTSSYVVEFDDFVVGPQAIVLGSAMTDWQSFTPVITASTTNPTIPTSGVTSHTAKWKRVGDSIELFYSYESTTVSGGNNGSGTYFFNLPSGLSIDNTKISGSGSLNGKVAVGVGRLVTTALRSAVMFVESGNKLIMQYESAGTDLTGLDSSTSIFTTNNAYLTFTARIPVVGWGSFSQMSSDTDTRVVSARYSLSSGSPVSGSQVNFANIVYDTHAAVTTGASWKYTAPISGYYRVSLALCTGSVNNIFALFKNGTLDSNMSYTLGSSASNNVSSSSTVLSLNAGDYFDVRPSTSNGSYAAGGGTGSSISTSNYITVERLSGPSVIAATETVAASYWCSANVSASTTQPINYDSKEFDLTNSVTTGSAWKFTAPVNGTYSVGYFIYTSNTSTDFKIYKNGSSYKNIGFTQTITGGLGESGNALIRLNAGDYIDFRPSGAVTVTGGVQTSNNCSQIYISRIGN